MSHIQAGAVCIKTANVQAFDTSYHRRAGRLLCRRLEAPSLVPLS